MLVLVLVLLLLMLLDFIDFLGAVLRIVMTCVIAVCLNWSRDHLIEHVGVS